MKITNIVIAILFAIFAIVQYNDPDPWLWIGLYLLVAIIAGLATKNIYPKWVISSTIIGCLIGVGMLLPDFLDWLNNGAESITQSMKAEKPHIELTREFFGLLLCASVLGFYLWQSKRKI